MTIRRTAIPFINLVFVVALDVMASDAEPPESVSTVIREQAQTFDVPGIAVASIREGDIAWIDTYGMATDAREVDANTTFNVASLTKPIFATLVMHLDADDAISLDEPLAGNWVDPDVADDSRHLKLTARLALSHQSGLPNWRGRNPLAFEFEPGARHEYSGEGFEYVRRAVERATNESMQRLMEIYVTGPAKMSATHFGWTDAIEPSIVTGYREDGSALDGAYLRQRGPNAAANTFSTIGDIASFAAWVARGADLSRSQFLPMATPQAAHDNPAETFSLGWRVIPVEGRNVLMHDGREGGLRTLMIIDPIERNGLVILTNSSNGELVTRQIIAAALPGGNVLNTQVDLNVWKFTTGQPPQQQAGLIGFIARSPTFTGKLLYAVQSALLPESGLGDRDSQEALELVDQVIQAHHAGTLDPDMLAVQLALLDADSGEGVLLTKEFDAEQARAWVDGLRGLLSR
ncbi:MAG: serine hydrolase domain-containing protein [Pseudomonadota bacterium]